MSNPFHQDNASQQGDDLTLAQVAQPESSFAYSEPDYTPPIGIAYLLILTTGFAIYFALESFFGRFEQAATIAQFVEWSSLVLYAICFAMTFASIWLFIQKKQRIGKFVTQPGHKLFLFLSIYFVLEFFPRIARHFFLMEEAGFLTNEDSIKYFLLASALFCLIIAIIAMVFVVFVRQRWRWVFVGLFLAWMLNMFSDILSANRFANQGRNSFLNFEIAIFFNEWSYLVSIGIISIPFFAAVLIDLVKQPKRDWVHWAGVLTFGFTMVLLPALVRIYFMFFFDPY